MASQPVPPQHVLEWVMLFPNGRPASAILRTNDPEEVAAWAKGWIGTLKLYRRTVLIGRWFPYDQVVDVDLPHQRQVEDLPRQRIRS